MDHLVAVACREEARGPGREASPPRRCRGPPRTRGASPSAPGAGSGRRPRPAARTPPSPLSRSSAPSRRCGRKARRRARGPAPVSSPTAGSAPSFGTHARRRRDVLVSALRKKNHREAVPRQVAVVQVADVGVVEPPQRPDLRAAADRGDGRRRPVSSDARPPPPPSRPETRGPRTSSSICPMALPTCVSSMALHARTSPPPRGYLRASSPDLGRASAVCCWFWSAVPPLGRTDARALPLGRGLLRKEDGRESAAPELFAQLKLAEHRVLLQLGAAHLARAELARATYARDFTREIS